MDIDFFKMKITAFERDCSMELSYDFKINSLWPVVKNWTNESFSYSCAWLQVNRDKNRIIDLDDFRRSYKVVAKPKEYKNDEVPKEERKKTIIVCTNIISKLTRR